MNGFARLTAKDNLVLIVSSHQKNGESITKALMHLLGHVTNGDVSGSFIDFKTSKPPPTKKPTGGSRVRARGFSEITGRLYIATKVGNVKASKQLTVLT